jgi:hypothetical protein
MVFIFWRAVADSGTEQRKNIKRREMSPIAGLWHPTAAHLAVPVRFFDRGDAGCVDDEEPAATPSPLSLLLKKKKKNKEKW